MKPVWLRQRYIPDSSTVEVRQALREHDVYTVCEGAACPNRQQCYADGTATFLILGKNCSRRCGYCALAQGKPQDVDVTEPQRVAAAARQLTLTHVVLTSVTRDDLADGGASHFAATIRAIRALDPAMTIEVLIPDFQGDDRALHQVLCAGPDVLNHNLETVEGLYAEVRPGAHYRTSLQLLQHAANHDGHHGTALVKSGLMLGLGEQQDEIRVALTDLRNAGCRMLTLGQYLQPTKQHLAVQRYVTPEEFAHWQQQALSMGFSSVVSGPLVRSSWHAAESCRHCR